MNGSPDVTLSPLLDGKLRGHLWCVSTACLFPVIIAQRLWGCGQPALKYRVADGTEQKACPCGHAAAQEWKVDQSGSTSNADPDTAASVSRPMQRSESESERQLQAHPGLPCCCVFSTLELRTPSFQAWGTWDTAPRLGDSGGRGCACPPASSCSPQTAWGQRSQDRRGVCTLSDSGQVHVPLMPRA